MPPLLWICRFFQVRLLLTSRALRKANSHTTAGFNEGIVGVRTSKSLVREEQNLVEFSHLTDTMYKHAVSNALYSALFLPKRNASSVASCATSQRKVQVC